MARKDHRALLRRIAKRYPDLCAIRGELCWLCGAAPKTRRLHIDHDHKTMTVRGLLCFRCNTALPSRVTPGWLRDAADYLDAEPIELEEAA